MTPLQAFDLACTEYCQSFGRTWSNNQELNEAYDLGRNHAEHGGKWPGMQGNGIYLPWNSMSDDEKLAYIKATKGL